MAIGNIIDSIQSVMRAAQNITAAIPGLQGVSGMIGTAEAVTEIGEKLLPIIDNLTGHVEDPRDQAAMQQTRAQLAAVISAKAESLADRLDG
jgi:hypothetical protein